MNVQAALRNTEQIKTKDLRNLENWKKIPEMLGFDGKYSANRKKAKF